MSQTNSYQIETKEMVKVAASGWLGTAMEFMDFQLYSLAAAIVFNEIFFPNTEYRHEHAYESCQRHGCEGDPDRIYSSKGRNQRTPDRRCQIGHGCSCDKGKGNDGGYVQAFLLCVAKLRNQSIVRSTVCRDRKVICQNHTKQECRIDPAVFIRR